MGLHWQDIRRAEHDPDIRRGRDQPPHIYMVAARGDSRCVALGNGHCASLTVWKVWRAPGAGRRTTKELCVAGGETLQLCLYGIQLWTLLSGTKHW